MTTEPIAIQFLDLTHKPKQYDIVEYFPDSSSEFTKDRLIKTRNQEVEGRNFLVCSIFERGAPKSAADRLRSLMELEAGKS